MKLVIILYFISIIFLFFLPVVCVKKYKPILNIEKSNNEIKLLQSESNNIITIGLEEYIMGVLIGEMPVSYEIEALKAQAIVARTYTLYKMKNSIRFT